MGDHRVLITIEFDAHGKTYRQKFNINYFDNGDGIDQRVVDFFAESWADALGRYEDQVREHFREQNKAEIEAQERKEFERLKAKYATT